MTKSRAQYLWSEGAGRRAAPAGAEAARRNRCPSAASTERTCRAERGTAPRLGPSSKLVGELRRATIRVSQRLLHCNSRTPGMLGDGSECPRGHHKTLWIATGPGSPTRSTAESDANAPRSRTVGGSFAIGPNSGRLCSREAVRGAAPQAVCMYDNPPYRLIRRAAGLHFRRAGPQSV